MTNAIEQIEAQLQRVAQDAWINWTTWIIYEAFQRNIALAPLDGEEVIDPDRPPSPPDAQVQATQRELFDAIVANRYTSICAMAKARGEPEPSRGSVEAEVLRELWEDLRANPAKVYINSSLVVPYDRFHTPIKPLSTTAASDLRTRSAVLVGAVVVGAIILWMTWSIWGSGTGIGTPSFDRTILVNGRDVRPQIVAVEPATVQVEAATWPVQLCVNGERHPDTITIMWRGYQGTMIRTHYHIGDPVEDTHDGISVRFCQRPDRARVYHARQSDPIEGMTDIAVDTDWFIGTDIVRFSIITPPSYDTIALRLPNGIAVTAAERVTDETGVRWIIPVNRNTLTGITEGAIWATTGGTVTVQPITIPDVRDAALFALITEPPSVRVIRPTVGPAVAEITVRTPIGFVLRDGSIRQRTKDGQELVTPTGTVEVSAGIGTTLRIPLHPQATAIMLGEHWMIAIHREGSS